VEGGMNPFGDILEYLLTTRDIPWRVFAAKMGLKHQPNHYASMRRWEHDFIRILSEGFGVPITEIVERLKDMGVETVRLYRRPPMGTELKEYPGEILEAPRDVRENEEKEWKVRKDRLARLLEGGE
jgi:hypothetical protein